MYKSAATTMGLKQQIQYSSLVSANSGPTVSFDDELEIKEKAPFLKDEKEFSAECQHISSTCRLFLSRSIGVFSWTTVFPWILVAGLSVVSFLLSLEVIHNRSIIDQNNEAYCKLKICLFDKLISDTSVTDLSSSKPPDRVRRCRLQAGLRRQTKLLF